MILYLYHDGYYYEVHVNMTTRSVDFILSYRDGYETRPTRCSWDDLDLEVQDVLLPKIRKAVKQYDANNT